MFALATLPLLLGADNRVLPVEFPQLIRGVPTLWVLIFASIALSVAFGYWFASMIRMREYGWKVSLILATFFASLLVVLFGQYKLGVDLQGGVILVYEVDEKATNELGAGEKNTQTWSMDALVQVLRGRLNET